MQDKPYLAFDDPILLEEGISRFAPAAKNFLEDFGEDAQLYGSLFKMKTYDVTANA
jgi:hypothetical protein